MKTKILIAMLLFVLLLAHPFGCKTRKALNFRKYKTQTDSSAQISVNTRKVNTDLSEFNRLITSERTKRNTKITLREIETTSKIAANEEYILDSVQPPDGSLNFTSKSGDKLNVQKDGKMLKLTQTDCDNNTVFVQKVKELIIEGVEEHEKKTDSTAQKNNRTQNESKDSSSKAKVKKESSEKTKIKSVERTFPTWKGLIALGIFGAVVWLVWRYFGKKIVL